VLRSRITTVVLSLVAVWLAALAVGAGYQRYTVGAQLDDLNGRIDDASRENTRLTGELDRMKAPQWLALLARQRLNYKLPDETVVFVYKAKESGIVSPPQGTPEDHRPNWRRWYDWALGR
jgi:cell division protein FtsB